MIAFKWFKRMVNEIFLITLIRLDTTNSIPAGITSPDFLEISLLSFRYLQNDSLEPMAPMVYSLYIIQTILVLGLYIDYIIYRLYNIEKVSHSLDSSMNRHTQMDPKIPKTHPSTLPPKLVWSPRKQFLVNLCIPKFTCVSLAMNLKNQLRVKKI